MLNLIPETFAGITAELQLKMMAVGLFWIALGVYAFFRIVTIRAWTPSADAVSGGRGRSREGLGLRSEPHLSVSEDSFMSIWFRRIAAILYIIAFSLFSRSGRPGREILGLDGGGYYYVESDGFIEKAIRFQEDLSDILRQGAGKVSEWVSYRVYLVNRSISYKWRQIHWTYKHL